MKFAPASTSGRTSGGSFAGRSYDRDLQKKCISSKRPGEPDVGWAQRTSNENMA